MYPNEDRRWQIVEAALRYDPIHEDLVRTLYQIHTAQGKPVKALKVLEDYAEALQAEHFPEEGAEDILESFWARPGPIPPPVSPSHCYFSLPL